MSKKPLQDLLSSLNAVISTNESTQFITGHVIYNPAYTYKFQLKTTIVEDDIATDLEEVTGFFISAQIVFFLF